MVLGGVVLGLSLRIPAGSSWFYAATFGIAAIWVVGAYAVGPPRLGPPRPVVLPVVVGAVLVGVFVVGSVVVKQIPFLDDQVRDVADHAAQGSWPVLVLVTAVTGIAEELFFRGALYDVVPRPVVVTTAVYGITTLATGNLLLAFAAVLLGAVVALERQRYGALLPAVLTHCTWSLAMLFLLPALFQG